MLWEAPKNCEAPAPTSTRFVVARNRAFRGFAKAGRAVIGFFKNTKATTAVEFAIVALPLIVLLLSILELAFIFIINTGVNVATATLAKQIRTGLVQAPGQSGGSSSGTILNRSDAISRLCDGIQLIPASICIRQLQIDVRPITSFQQTVAFSPVSGTTFDSSNLCYYSGNAGAIVEMRTYYLYGFFNPVLLTLLSNISTYINGGSSSSAKYFLIQNAQVFKTENYSGSSNTGAGC